MTDCSKCGEITVMAKALTEAEDKLAEAEAKIDEITGWVENHIPTYSLSPTSEFQELHEILREE